MRGRDNYLDHLARVPMFSACSKKELEKIGRASDEIHVDTGHVLVEEGKPGHEFFLILDGTANVLRNGRKIATLGRGQYFGELSLLDRGPRSATVKAATDLDVLVLGQREFGGVLDSVPALSRKLLAAMASRLRAADTKALAH
ncbi:MAG: cyclic nucleotide-binding domain-containing protein [Actinobacteria bacterium]|nr:MAG: cyclic nucleotide-binding domain-containing protein [Actinomycetota bacterium]